MDEPPPGDKVEEEGRGVASGGKSTSITVSIPRRLASCPPADLPCGPRRPSATANRPNGRGGGARLAHNPCTISSISSFSSATYRRPVSLTYPTWHTSVTSGEVSSRLCPQRRQKL